MIVTVQLFARAKDLAGSEEVRVELPEQATVGQLRVQLSERVPRLASLLERAAMAVNGEFADVNTPLTGTDEIALLPPVSGG